MQAGSQIHALQMALFDTLQFGGRSAWANAMDAFKTGKQVLDTSAFTDGGSHANPFELTGGVLENIDSGDYAHAAVNAVGNTVGLPGRLINSLHELSQQIIYRSRVYAKAMTARRRHKVSRIIAARKPLLPIQISTSSSKRRGS